VPSTDSFLAFAALSFVIIAVPGPSVMFVISRALSMGRRAALTTVVGNAAGVYLQVLLVAVGLGSVVERSVVAFNAVKLIGAAYLVWLGVQAIRHRRALSSVLDTDVSVRSGRTLLLDGVVVGVANPKAIVFFAAILPQFVDRSGAPAGVQMAVLGLVFVAIALVSDSLWGLAAGSARQWFVRSPRRLERIGAAGGLVMMGLGVRLALTGRRQ
jgi:threonine/homoserine/homoserine lactone efflux protein